MAEGKYIKVDDTIYPVIGEYAKVADAIVPITINAIKVDDAIEQIAIAESMPYTAETQNAELYRLTGAGVEDWHYDAADGSVVAVNADGESYWGVGTDVYKINADGTLGWIYASWAILTTSIAVENREGTTYVYVGDYAGNVLCLKDDGSPPTFVWAENVDVTYEPPIYALAVDTANGFVYAGASGYSYSKGVWRAQTSTGIFVKIYATTNNVISLAVDTGSPASVYYGDNVGTYRKISSAGYVYWTKTLTGSIAGIEIGRNGLGYLSCESEKKVYQFNPATGVTTWSYAPSPATSAYPYQIGVDASGNVYAVYRNDLGTSGNYIYKIDSDGDFVWRWQSYVDVRFHGMAVLPGIEAAGH